MSPQTKRVADPQEQVQVNGHDISRFLLLRLFQMYKNIFCLALVNGFYLPGIRPKDYQQGDPVDLFVNALSAKDSLIPLDFYDPRLDFCEPTKETRPSESLGSILFGDRLASSNFQVIFN